MKSWMILLFLALAGPVHAGCAPTSLTHIVTTEITPGLDPQAFDAQPKIFWRLGIGQSRLEEQDPRNKVHQLAVIDEPNIWMANMFDGTGRHIVDPGPGFNTRAVVFPDDRISPKILDLEFGCEAAFVAAKAPKVDHTDQVNGVSYDVHRFSDGMEAVEILTKAGAGVPAFSRYYRDGKLVWAIRYDLYEVGAVGDAALFIAPPGITYVDTPIQP